MRSFLLSLLVFLLLPHQTFGSHAQGLDISYQCLGGNQYQFTLNLYRDCSGISVPNSVNINLASQSCGSNFNVNLPLASGPVEVSPLCSAQIGQSTCASPPCTSCLPGVEQFTYQGTFSFSASCPDWVVSFEECCRNNSITNLNNPSAASLFVSSTLDNSAGQCNSSPIFTSSPVPYACAEQLYCYNHGAVDPDGDSLSYALVNPMDGPAPGTNINYSSPLLSPTNPLFDTTGTVQFDPQTGSLCIIPSNTLPQQVVVIAVEVTEWRNGIPIGTTTRDIQIVVLPCINTQPGLVPNSIVNLSAGALLQDSNSVEICPNVPLNFDIIAGDPNAADIVTMASNLALVLPGATFNTTGNNPVTGTFSWTPTTNDVGFHNFTVTIQDDGCPILGSQIFNFDITVVPSTSAGPDETYCPAGSPVPLQANGGSVFTWNTLSGGPANLSCNPCQSPDVSPSNSVVLEVVSDLSATCKNRDTLTITVVPDFILDTSKDTTICRYGLANLSTTVSPNGVGFSPYTYLWSPPDSLSSLVAPNVMANPTDSTRYVVAATSAAGCTITDTIAVHITGVAPQVVIPTVDTICEGAPLDLGVQIFQDCGATSIPCSGPISLDSIGLPINTSAAVGPFLLDNTFQYSNRKQYIFSAQELAGLGLNSGGRINGIALDVTTAGDPIRDVEIFMGCVPFACFSNDTFLTGLTQVKNPFNWTPNTGWSNVNLDFPYMWDGQSNLVIEICVNNQQPRGVPSLVATDLYPCNVINFLNNPLAGGACGQATGSPFNERPRMRFSSCEALPPGLTYTWSPPTFLNDPNIANPTATPTTSTTYSLDVSDGFCVGSDVVSVIASPTFLLDAGLDSTLCLNQPYQANVSVAPAGAYTFAWTPPSGVNSITDQNPVIFAPDTTTYVVAVTSAENCTQSDSFVINIDGIAPIVQVSGDDTICPPVSGGTPASLTTTITQNCGLTTLPCSGPVQTGAIEDPVGFGNSFYGPHFLFAPPTTVSLRRQYLFTPAELDTMGLQPGMKISGIYLDYTSANDPNPNVQIRMGCVSQDTFDAGLNFITGLDVVMTATSITPNLGYTFFPFTTDYIWDGMGNLAIDICTPAPVTGASATAGSDIRVHTVGGNAMRTLYANDFSGTLNGCDIAQGNARTFFRPNMQFQFCDAQPPGLLYNWTPVDGLSAINIPDPIASPNSTTTYTLTVDGGGSCTGGDQFTVAIDSTNFAVGTALPTAGCPTPVYQMSTNVVGPAFSPNLPSCGVNGTPCSQATYSRQVGSGSNNTQTFYSPFFTDDNNSRIQYLYRASDLTAAGVQSGTITAIAINITNADSTDLDSLRINMGCTNVSNMSVATGFLPTTNVLGPVPFNPINGFSLFTLDNPFDWDGSSNLVIEVCNSNLNAGSASNVEYTSGTGHNGTLLAFGNTASGCQLNTNLFVNAGFPNMQFTVCPTPPLPFAYSWTPVTGLSNPSIANPIYIDPDPTSEDTLTVLISGPFCTILDTVVVPACILPVEYFHLTGEQTEGTVLLDWTTLHETNVDHFKVKRRNRDGNLEDIGEVDALGNTTDITHYNLIDPSPFPGDNTYRVTAVDLDGSVTHSNEVTLNFSQMSGLINLYPNPSTEARGFNIDFYAAEEGTLDIEIVDIWGRSLSRQQHVLLGGYNQLQISTQGLAQGSYFARLRFARFAQTYPLHLIE